ncbi:MAG: hypothetical protein ACYC01_01910 [Lutibacter sp.]
MAGETNKSTFELVNELITAISHILWPIVVLVVVYIFKTEISSLLNRIRKGKFFGQELELDEEIKQFKIATEIASNSITVDENLLKNEEKKNDEKLNEILESSITDPTIAIIMLSREIEKELRNISGAFGILDKLEYKSISNTFEFLIERNLVSNTILKSVKIFLDLRNKIVHGKAIEDEKQIIRVIDIGSNLLETLKNIPRAKYIVFKTDIDLFSDPECKNIRPDIKGIILETISPENIHISYNLRPTNVEDYKVGDSITWEWSFRNIWDKTFYKNPDDGRIINAFDSSAEFIGRPFRKL